jgi:cell division protein FtsZ
MTTNADTGKQPAAGPPKLHATKIFGIGGAGCRVLGHLARRALPGTALVAVDSDAEAITRCGAPESLALDSKVLRGIGTGGDAERGRALAEENVSGLKAACQDAGVIFVVAGLGGGTGTGIAPVLARVAREAGAQVLALVSLPFECEGNLRRSQARLALEHLETEADGVICLPHQRVFKLIDEQTSVADTFQLANELHADLVNGVWRLLLGRGFIDIHRADACALLRDHNPEILFASVEATGATRSREAVDKLLAHPLMDGGQALAEADAVLVSLVGGPDLTMSEVDRVMEPINRKSERAQVLMGAVLDDQYHDRLGVFVIAARRDEASTGGSGSLASTRADSARGSRPIDLDAINRAAGGRPKSRFVPPPPELPRDKVLELMAGQPAVAGRARKHVARLRQGQLPLEIISKGRFDKSEPTIHKGEDLDVPTYIRRGVPLN